MAEILVGSLDPRLHVGRFEPELVDTFALITRAGAKLSRPVADLLEQFTAHLIALIDEQPTRHRG